MIKLPLRNRGTLVAIDQFEVIDQQLTIDPRNKHSGAAANISCQSCRWRFDIHDGGRTSIGKPGASCSTRLSRRSGRNVASIRLNWMGLEWVTCGHA